MKKIILGLVISGLILGGCSSKMDQFVEPQGTPRPSIEPLPTDASFAARNGTIRWRSGSFTGNRPGLP